MFEASRQGAVDLIAGKAPLDRSNAPQLAEVLQACVERGQPRVVLNLAQVPLIDSAGLELLLDYRDRCRARGGSLKLATPSALCRDILRITGVAAQLEVHDDALAAVGSFAR